MNIIRILLNSNFCFKNNNCIILNSNCCLMPDDYLINIYIINIFYEKKEEHHTI